MYVYQLNKKTALIELKDLFPTCHVLQSERSDLMLLQCFGGACPVDNRCMEKLVPRVKSLFAQGVATDLIIAYWSETVPATSVKGCEFWSDYREPKLRILYPDNLKRFLKAARIIEVNRLD